MILENLNNSNNLEVETKLLKIIDTLKKEQNASKQNLLFLCDHITKKELEILCAAANDVKQNSYGNSVFIRGLIEISNYCSANCHYCGIRLDNDAIERYRLTKEQILDCCSIGYELGIKTIVLQSGEDVFLNDDFVCDLVKSIKELYPDIAITLSLGERSRQSYQNLYDHGADRFLVRHEAASKQLYEYLHPKTSDYKNRIRCLNDLKQIGYQTGCGFMVGSPRQQNSDLVEDFIFTKALNPEMVGIGPFIANSTTIFKDAKMGTVDQTRFCIAVIRLLVPFALLPATTALATIDPDGREKVLFSGANVVMPNLSPTIYRAKYQIYENKVATDDEAAESIYTIQQKLKKVGLFADMSIGHYGG